MKDLVQESTIDCSKKGMEMQAMDSSHVSLCTMQLKSEGFEFYRCDRPVALGLSLTNLAKILKCASNDDSVAMKSEDDSDMCSFVFESSKNDKISEFEFKLMNIEGEQMSIPDQKYACTVKMSSKEFRTIVTDLQQLGDTCIISVTKEGVQFSVSGDMGTANVTVRQKTAVDDEKGESGCTIDMTEAVRLRFALRYLVNCTKATPLSERVILSMSADNPLVVEYVMEAVGDVKYYLAPKMDEEATA